MTILESVESTLAQYNADDSLAELARHYANILDTDKSRHAARDVGIRLEAVLQMIRDNDKPDPVKSKLAKYRAR